MAATVADPTGELAGVGFTGLIAATGVGAGITGVS